MPRIFKANGDPLDFHHSCMPTRFEAEMAFAGKGDKDDRFEYDAQSAHPPYSGEEYDCHECGGRLDDRSNGAF